MRILDIRECALFPVHVQAFQDLFEGSESLKTLRIVDCEMGDGVETAVRDLARRNVVVVDFDGDARAAVVDVEANLARLRNLDLMSQQDYYTALYRDPDHFAVVVVHTSYGDGMRLWYNYSHYYFTRQGERPPRVSAQKMVEIARASAT